MSLILLRGRPFSPREIAARMPCAWLEPRIGNMWQEHTGVTPTTSGGQTVGLLLDQSQGAVLGPELVTDGGFDSETGWVKYGTAVITNGKATCTDPTGALCGVSQAMSIATGATYRIDYALVVRAGTVRIGDAAGGAIQTHTTSGAYVVNVIGYGQLATALYIVRHNQGAAIDFDVDNISVRQILGNHASQSTAANRPKYQLDTNGRPYLEHNSTQFLTASLPDRGGGVFSSNGSIYWATPTGMQSMHGQAISTSLSLPAANTNVYSCLVTPERLNAVYENKLGLYFLRLAGLL